MNFNNLARRVNAVSREINDPELCAALQEAYDIALAKGYVTSEITSEVVQPKDD